MLSATMSRFQNHLRDAEIPSSVIARVGGVSPSSLSAALRDLTYLGSEKEVELLELIIRVAAYREALRPLPLPENWENLRALIDSSVEPSAVRQMVSTIFGRESE